MFLVFDGQTVKTKMTSGLIRDFAAGLRGRPKASLLRAKTKR